MRDSYLPRSSLRSSLCPGAKETPIPRRAWSPIITVITSATASCHHGDSQSLLLDNLFLSKMGNETVELVAKVRVTQEASRGRSHPRGQPHAQGLRNLRPPAVGVALPVSSCLHSPRRAPQTQSLYFHNTQEREGGRSYYAVSPTQNSFSFSCTVLTYCVYFHEQVEKS